MIYYATSMFIPILFPLCYVYHFRCIFNISVNNINNIFRCRFNTCNILCVLNNGSIAWCKIVRNTQRNLAVFIVDGSAAFKHRNVFIIYFHRLKCINLLFVYHISTASISIEQKFCFIIYERGQS